MSMNLDQKLSVEDKEYILNELERERRRNLVEKLSEEVCNQHNYKSRILKQLKLKEDRLNKTFLFALLPDRLGIDYPLYFSDKDFWKQYDVIAATKLFAESAELNGNQITDKFIPLFRILIEYQLQESCKSSKAFSEIKKLNSINISVREATTYLKSEMISTDYQDSELYSFLNYSLSLSSFTGKKAIYQLLDELSIFIRQIVSQEIIKDYSCYKTIMAFNEFSSIEELLECSTIQSPYQIVCKLGQGTSGTIYKAYSPELKQYFALKIINDKFNPREAELMAKLKKGDLENIVQIHDAGKHIVTVDGEGRYAIVMEYVEGNHLADIMHSLNGSLSEVLQVGTQLLNGIESLRNYDITHRDLNPRNIKVDKYGHVKILDFGIATDEESPVQIDGRRYGVPDSKNADDLFSLGLITYEMFTGKHLVYEKSKEIGSKTHANKVYELKQDMFVEGILKHDLEQKIPSEIRSFVLSCLYGEDNETIKRKLINAKEDLKYYFMKRNDLILRIKQLEGNIDGS